MLPPSELEAAIDRLYQLPIGEFTEARNALAAEQKASGNKVAAARVKALSKPTAVAWVVNQLYWKDREPFEALAVSMAELAAAQREALRGSGAVELREATRRKGEQLQQLLRSAERRLVEGGGQGGPAVLQRVSATLEAVASPRPTGAVDAPRPGRLVGELQPAGFDLALGLGALDLPPVPPHAKHERTSPEADSAPLGGTSPDPESVRARQLAIQQAEFEVARLRREAAAAARAHSEAESRASAARADVAQLEERLQQARARAEEKTVAESDARRAHEAGRAGLGAAEAALEALKRPR